jgi:hypothetical protein
MIQLSDIAATVLLESLRASGVGPDKGLRLKEKDSKMTLNLDIPGNEDRVIRHGKSVVLIVDQDTEKDIGDALVDIDDKHKRNRLVLRRNVKEKD